MVCLVREVVIDQRTVSVYSCLLIEQGCSVGQTPFVIAVQRIFEGLWWLSCTNQLPPVVTCA
jgi:hypothetical protein